MLTRLIHNCVARQVEQGILKDEEREAYEYGYFIIALEAVNISVMVVIGILFQCFFPLLFFTLFLIALRKYAGGIHAPNHIACASLSALLELAVVLTLRSQLWKHLFLPLLPLALCGCLIIWGCSPVAASTKPLSSEESVRFRKKARGRLLLELLAAALLFLFHQEQLCFVVMLDFIVIASAMLLGMRQ